MWYLYLCAIFTNTLGQGWGCGRGILDLKAGPYIQRWMCTMYICTTTVLQLTLGSPWQCIPSLCLHLEGAHWALPTSTCLVYHRCLTPSNGMGSCRVHSTNSIQHFTSLNSTVPGHMLETSAAWVCSHCYGIQNCSWRECPQQIPPAGDYPTYLRHTLNVRLFVTSVTLHQPLVFILYC